MEIEACREEIRLKLTGGVLDLELDDKALDSVINAAFREIQRYICSTKFITLPYKSCIDLSEYKVSSVSNIYRTTGYGVSSDTTSSSLSDPMYIAAWQMLGGNGNVGYISNWALNYSAWNTMLQIRNTLSTDLAFQFDRSTQQLYINGAYDAPTNITIEYIPRYDDVSEIVDDYWIDMLMRLAVALAKVTVGRIRSRFTQSNAIWSQDGERLLEEGNAELTEIRTYLQNNTMLTYPID